MWGSINSTNEVIHRYFQLDEYINRLLIMSESVDDVHGIVRLGIRKIRSANQQGEVAVKIRYLPHTRAPSPSCLPLSLSLVVFPSPNPFLYLSTTTTQPILQCNMQR